MVTCLQNLKESHYITNVAEKAACSEKCLGGWNIKTRQICVITAGSVKLFTDDIIF